MTRAPSALCAALALSVLLAAVPGAAQQDDSVLVLELSEGARVAAEESIDEGLLRISLWHQEIPIGAQVAGAGVPEILTFSTVPVSQYSIRLDLRLAEEVRGVTIDRTSSTRLEVRFASRPFEGQTVVLADRRAAEAADVAANTRRDRELAAILARPQKAVPPHVRWDPITWPMGFDSPVRVPLRADPEPHPFSTPPKEVREAWREDTALFTATTLADKGEVDEAMEQLRGLPNRDDRTTALIALARGYVWSRPGPSGEPTRAGRSADAYLLAAGLMPDASWAPWARGQAGYGFERELRFHEALLQYEMAIAAAPDHTDRPWWDLGVGLSLVQSRRPDEGVERLLATVGVLPTMAREARFTARRTVAHALWEQGEVAAAAAVLDLLLDTTPEIARDARYDGRWARMYLDGGRTAEALPFLERIEAHGDAKVDRERARWWLHEVALAHRDSKQARQWLRELILVTPGSVLVPMAQARLQVLDAIVAEDEDEKRRELYWQEVAVAMREHALTWPYTPIEDEALSLTAQLFAYLGLTEEALELTHWVESRTPNEGGAIAYEEQICRLAPRAFSQMRARGELVRALGVYREFLDKPKMHGCVDIATRTDAAATAVTAGLPDLAARWLGQAVAEGTGGSEEARNLVELAHVYLADGKVQAAEQTLAYLEQADLPRPVAVADAAWGDVAMAQEDWGAAIAAYDAGLAEATRSVRTAALVPSLQFRRGSARERSGDLPGALEDLRVSVPQGGSEDPATGWLRLASVGARVGGSPDVYAEVLTACDEAAANDPEGRRARAVSWYRAVALEGVGRSDEAAPLLTELAAQGDAWGLFAREHVAAARFAESFDAILDAASEG